MPGQGSLTILLHSHGNSGQAVEMHAPLPASGTSWYSPKVSDAFVSDR